MPRSILEVRNLCIAFQNVQKGRSVPVVRDVSFTVAQGDSLGIIGESGSGKSQICLATMGLSPKNASVSGDIILDGEHLLEMSESQLRPVRGRKVSMVFQDSMSSLTPHMRVGEQLIEGVCLTRKMGRRAAWAEACKMLEIMQFPNAEVQMKRYPHQLSGGMRQRIMIAMAVLTNPKILIADEPTTSLDVTIQAQILELFNDLRPRTGTSIIFISHNFGVIASVCERVLVIHEGQAVESGPVRDIFSKPAHPYTELLVSSIPGAERASSNPGKRFPASGGEFRLGESTQRSGCSFAGRCANAKDLCFTVIPEMSKGAHGYACHFPINRKRFDG